MRIGTREGAGPVLALLLFGGVSLAVEPDRPQKRIRGDRIAVGVSVVVPEDVHRDGDLICVFGNVRVDGTLGGSVILVGGSLELAGEVRGDVIGVLSDLVLLPGSRIGRDLVNAVGTLHDEAEHVGGTHTDIPLRLPRLGLGRPLAVLTSLALWARGLGLVLFVVVLLIAVEVSPARVRRLGDEAPSRLPAAFLVGLLAYLALPLMLALLAILVVGIPLIPVALLGFVGLTWLGRVALLARLGRQLGGSLGGNPGPLAAALFGAAAYALVLLLPLLVGGVAGLVAHLVLAAILWLALDVPALGLALLTRAGSPRAAATSTASGTGAA